MHLIILFFLKLILIKLYHFSFFCQLFMNIVRNTISLSFFARLTFKTETENNTTFKRSKSELFRKI